MNKVEVIKGIDMTIAGLEAIKSALGAEEIVAPAKKTVGKSVEKSETPAMNEPVAQEAPVVGKFDVEQLRSMKYNDFKKFAAQLGVDCKGTRDEIMQRVLALELDGTIADGESTVEEPVEDEAPVKSDKLSGGKKLAKKQADEPARDEFDEQAEEIAKDTDVKDIIEALSDVSIKATKKNAVEKLAEALRKGLIELDDDDDDEGEDVADDTEETTEAEEQDTEDSSEDDEEIGADSYFPEYDPNGYNNPEDMTDERREAVEDKMDELITAYSEEEISDEDVQSYVEENATEDEIELLGDDPDETEIFKMYMELVKRTIDNDGEEHEPSDPYELGEHDMCCGHELKYVKKTKKYVCEHCGTEYEAE